jgi:hypothetical protein
MKTIKGDLLAITEGVILHQVNCLGVTGGLAGALRRKYPAAFDGYLDACKQLVQPPFLLTVATPKLLIGHVFGQPTPGPNTDLEMVECALTAARGELAEFVPLYAPYLMGCGLGGGDWPQYSALLEKHFPHIVIVRLPNS